MYAPSVPPRLLGSVNSKPVNFGMGTSGLVVEIARAKIVAINTHLGIATLLVSNRELTGIRFDWREFLNIGYAGLDIFGLRYASLVDSICLDFEETDWIADCYLCPNALRSAPLEL